MDQILCFPAEQTEVQSGAGNCMVAQLVDSTEDQNWILLSPDL